MLVHRNLVKYAKWPITSLEYVTKIPRTGLTTPIIDDKSFSGARQEIAATEIDAIA